MVKRPPLLNRESQGDAGKISGGQTHHPPRPRVSSPAITTIATFMPKAPAANASRLFGHEPSPYRRWQGKAPTSSHPLPRVRQESYFSRRSPV